MPHKRPEQEEARITTFKRHITESISQFAAQAGVTEDEALTVLSDLPSLIKARQKEIKGEKKGKDEE